MPRSAFSPAALVRAHGRTFVVWAAAGAILGLGVRSLFVDVGGTPRDAIAAPTPAEHHVMPGHEGHGHDGSTAMPAADESEHAGHDGDDASDKGKQRPPADEPEDREPPEGKKTAKKAAAKPAGVLLDLGNTACPVMGGDSDGETYSEWSGLRVSHCCPGCIKRFLANPESLLDDVSSGWREAAKAAKAIDAASGKERDRLLAAAAKKWKVLRKPGAPEPAGLLVDLGNGNCPTLGGEVDGKTFTDWNGLRVGHCCPGCSEKFLENPEKLLDEVSPGWREARDDVKKVNAAKGEGRAEALAALAKRFKVVREPAPEVVK